MATVWVRMLGGLAVELDGRVVEKDDWPARRARELVAVLALHGGRVPRDVLIETLWPHLDAEAGGRNLRKAAHHARRALGQADAVVLRGGSVELLPGRERRTDVEDFLTRAAEALATGDPGRCAEVARGVDGPLLPEAPYEPWTQDPRRRVAGQHAALLRAAHDLERLVELEPTDEGATAELMERALDDGRRHLAIQWYERLRLALARELGTTPGPRTRELYERCTSGARPTGPPFVGRGPELARISEVLQDRLRRGGTEAVLVRGRAGMGKTALGREVLHRAQEHGWRTIVATASPSGPPYGPIRAALEQLLTDVPLQRLPERTRSVLGELDAITALAPPLPGAITRHQVIAAFRRALAHATPERPTALLVEDVHLADEASADVLHQLAVGAAGGPPLVVLAAVRAEWIRTSLPRGVQQLLATEGATLVDLPALSDDEAAELVRAAATGAAPDSGEVDRIVRAAAGSPFFVLELTRALATGPVAALPATLREAVRDRYGAVGADAREALELLAVAEQDADLDSVLALTGLREEEAFALLDDALAAGILEVAGGRYRFVHELVRRALVDELAPHQRLALHRRAAARLQATGARPALVAEHLLQGGRPDEAAGPLLEAARSAVRVGAYADALAHLDRLPASAPRDEVALSLRAEVLDALGDPRAPDAYAAAALATGPPRDQDLRARQALAQLKASEPFSALETLRGVEPHTTVGKLAAALTYSASAAIGVFGDAAFAAAKADEAHRLALELGDPGAILDATWAHALAAHAQGELPTRLREYLRQTQALPEIATRVFDGQLCVTERMLHGGLPNDEIIAFADGLAAEAQRLGAQRGQAFARTLRGEAAILAGRLDEAREDFADGARLHGAIGAAAGEALSLLGLAQVATARGDHEHARPHLADALLLARESEVGHHTLDRIYGSMVEAAGAPDDALEVVREAEEAIRGPAETCPTCRIAFIVPALIAAARAGDLERATRYRHDVDVALEVIALPPAWHAAGDEARGWQARALGRDEEARALFAKAASGFRAWGQPLDAERCEAYLAAPA